MLTVIDEFTRRCMAVVVERRLNSDNVRRISRTVLSAGSFLLIDFCLIFVPFGHYDEPEILRYAITSIRPKGADVRQAPWPNASSIDHAGAMPAWTTTNARSGS